MDRKRKPPPIMNTIDCIGTSVKPIIQMSGQTYSTPVTAGSRNHPVQKIISTSGSPGQLVDSPSINTRQQIRKSPGILRQHVNLSPGNARQQVNVTPGSINSLNHYSTPGSAIQDYSTPSQQDYTTPSDSRYQNNYSFDDTREEQVYGMVNTSNSQSINDALRAVGHNIEKLRCLQDQVEERVYRIEEDVDEIRNRLEEALLLPLEQEIRIDLVHQLKEINALENDLHKQRLVMKLVERQLQEHIENQKQLELAECNFQMKKRQFEAEQQKNREDFEKQQRYRDESYSRQQQSVDQKNDTIAQIVKTMPEVSEIERMTEMAIASEEVAAASEAEAPVRDTEKRRKAEGIPKVRFRGDGNEIYT